MPGYERFLVQIFITLIPVIGLYFSMKDKATKQENRLTILEKDIENLNEFKNRPTNDSITTMNKIRLFWF